MASAQRELFDAAVTRRIPFLARGREDRLLLVRELGLWGDVPAVALSASVHRAQAGPVSPRPVRTVAGAVTIGGGLMLALAWRASGNAMHPAPGQVPWGLEDYPDLVPEPVKVFSPTGVTLYGRFFHGRCGATVVLTHGYGGLQDEMLPVVNTLHAAGFNVFTYDMRGCIGTEGEITLGAREQDDLHAVIDAISMRPEVDSERIGALGFSMGAATTILAAADDSRIRAVVADSSWSDIDHWVKRRLRDLVLRPWWHFSPLSLKVLEIRTGARLRDLRPVDVIGRLSPRPILLIHGADDEIVPPGDSERNCAAAGSIAELWMVQGAAHGDTIRPGGATQSERIAAFFGRALRGGHVHNGNGRT